MAKRQPVKSGNRILVSVIMPTLNSEKTIARSLDSIRSQNFPQNKIEIMVIDGGSTDRTIAIAKKYRCVVLPNPRVQQEYAKHIGMLKARGQYAMYLDSDEVLHNPNAILNRVEIMENNPEIKIVLTGGYKKPKGFSVINDYINTFSDPFAFFMHGLSSEAGYFMKSLSRKWYVKTVADEPVCRILEFRKNSMRPLIDISAGNTLNLGYFRKANHKTIRDVSVIPRAFYLITNGNPRVAMLKDDWVVHYSADSFKKFFNKIKWRVIVNIHYRNIPGTGFSNREEFEPLWFRLKKFLFPVYAFTLVIPLLQGIVYSITRRAPILLMQLPLSVYTAGAIVYYYFLKLVGIKPRLMTYGNEIKELKL